jgi:hypothetical protein
MHVTPERVDSERDWVVGRAGRIATLINEVRAGLGALFGTEVGRVSEAQVREEAVAVFDDGDLAVNVAALVAILRDLDVDGDYPGFVVDELLGRELAGTIAGNQPLRLLAEATFHYADVHTHGGDDEAAGLDDLDAALAAGFQTRLPGGSGREEENPFDGRER